MSDCSNPIGWINPLGTLATGIFIYILNDINQKRKVKIEKLERIYSLCQKLYDGHKKQVNNARHNLPQRRNDYLENRTHPGEEMSEIKMLVRSYFPELEDHMVDLDNGHSKLKSSFEKIDTQLVRAEINGPTPPDTLMDHLSILSRGSTTLKDMVSIKLIKLSTPYYKKWIS